MHLDFKEWLQVFLLNYSFGDTDFYYFSVDQTWYNGIKWVKDVYQFSQSIYWQMKNKIITIASHNGNMSNLKIKNNYTQLGAGGIKQSDVVNESAYVHVFIYSASLCLLFGAFNQFTFKVIIEMYDPITIFLIALGLFSVGMSFPSLSSCLEKFL